MSHLLQPTEPVGLDGSGGIDHPCGIDRDTLDAAPLGMLLGAAKDRFIAEFDRRMADSQFCALRLANSANVLRHLEQGPRRASQIVTQGGITKQAVSQQIAHLERNGYLASEPDPCDQRARILSLTPKGRAAQTHVLATFAAIERDWAESLEDGDAAHLRRVLTAVLRQLD